VARNIIAGVLLAPHGPRTLDSRFPKGGDDGGTRVPPSSPKQPAAHIEGFPTD